MTPDEINRLFTIYDHVSCGDARRGVRGRDLARGCVLLCVVLPGEVVPEFRLISKFLVQGLLESNKLLQLGLCGNSEESWAKERDDFLIV